MRNTHGWIYAGLIVALAAGPLPAQRGGGGVGGGGLAGGGLGLGRAPGAVTGTVHDQGSVGAKGNGSVGKGQGQSADAVTGVTQNTQLSGRLQSLLPPGTTPSAAAAGFKNEGQFIAAVHVAHNLTIPFDQLKSQMTGTNPVSLGKAIQNLQPNLDSNTVKDNVKLADRQAERDIQQAASGNKPDGFVGRLTSNTNLSTRLTAMLPAGTTLANAATGFKNEGQFIATLHAANNLNIPFAELKDRVTAGESLGAAIHDLKPSLDAKASNSAAADAENQSKDDRVQAAGSVSVSANTQSTAR